MKSSHLLRNIPSVSDLLESPPLKGLVERISHNVVVEGARSVLDDLRQELQQKAGDMPVPAVGELAERIARKILRDERPVLRPVINATGVILHTGLGRAPLAEQAVDDVVVNSRDYCSLEFDLASSARSHRTLAVQHLLTQLTGAEAALVVNNNAAATLLVLTSLADGRHVIVSRGQLVEIGGSYRLPEIMAASGALLREVGTTNKTHPRDYQGAIDESTAALMRVHTSNYRVMGFASDVSIQSLVAIGREHRLLVIDDIGSGALLDVNQFGFSQEPLARASIEAGADVAMFSGDKLLGGPQCGIILGRRELIEKMSRHPLARAVRVGKMTLAALSATLKLYRDPDTARRFIPVLQLLSTPVDNLKNRAERLAPQLNACAAIGEARAMEDVAFLGGGSLPTQQLPTWCIALTPQTATVEQLAKSLRTAEAPVVGRIRQNQLLLDLRTVFPRQDQQLVQTIRALSD